MLVMQKLYELFGQLWQKIPLLPPTLRTEIVISSYRTSSMDSLNGGLSPISVNLLRELCFLILVKCRITTIIRRYGGLIWARFELIKELNLIDLKNSNQWWAAHERFKWSVFRIKFVCDQFRYRSQMFSGLV